MSDRGTKSRRILALLVLLYVFLAAISLMGSSFKLLGREFTETLITTTNNPIVGMMVGMLATALIQSSSTTTSLVVGLVGAGGLTVANAVPMIMGANVGTTVTNTLVAMAAMSRREEFRRSFAGATMHDFFNVMALAILLPIELATGVLRKSADFLATSLVGSGEVEFHSPVKEITKPVAKWILHSLENTGLPEGAVGAIALGLSLAAIFLALSRLPRLMKEMFLARAEGAFHRHLTRGGIVGMLIGTFITVLVQSSSITTSLLIPMIGAGILPLRGAFAITLGANIGTTVTALLASAAGTHDSVTIALVHLLFNLAGIGLIYPIPRIREIPINLARRLADLSMRSRLVPVLYLLIIFFLLPGFIILGQRMLAGS